MASLDGASSVGNPFFEDYRYLIIPPGQPATTGPVITSKSALDYSKMGYEEIVEHLNIPQYPCLTEWGGQSSCFYLPKF